MAHSGALAAKAVDELTPDEDRNIFRFMLHLLLGLPPDPTGWNSDPTAQSLLRDGITQFHEHFIDMSPADIDNLKFHDPRAFGGRGDLVGPQFYNDDASKYSYPFTMQRHDHKERPLTAWRSPRQCSTITVPCQHIRSDRRNYSMSSSFGKGRTSSQILGEECQAKRKGIQWLCRRKYVDAF